MIIDLMVIWCKGWTTLYCRQFLNVESNFLTHGDLILTKYSLTCIFLIKCYSRFELSLLDVGMGS